MKDDRLVEMRVFKAVVDAGGFTAAAHQLDVSQPFVSQNIASLERRLGVTLLHRSTRTYRLTAEGERFLAACNRILDEIAHTEAQIGSAQAAGDLRITAPLAFGMDQVVPRLPAFLEAHPQIRLHLALSDVLANLIDDGVDVAVRMGRLQDSSLIGRRLCGLQRIVVAAPAYADAHGLPQVPEALMQHNCLLWSGFQEHLNRWPFLVGGERQEVAARGNFRSSNGLTLFQLCTAGVGIMRCAEHLALPAIRRGELVPLLSEYLAPDDTAIHAVFLPERQLVPRIRTFVDYLSECFRQPPWQA